MTALLPQTIARDMYGSLTPLAMRNMFESDATRNDEPVKASIFDLTEVPYVDSAGLGMIVSHCVRYQAKAREKSAEVSVVLQEGLPKVSGFAGELNQIWGNLIENALDAVLAGGRVALDARREGQRVVVRVIDDGPAISAQNLARIFDPFFTTKPMGQGTGLGLGIVRRLVRHNDGTIEVESRPGRTESRVMLPAARTGQAGG
jgi:signal transduction histidine kinase